MKSEISKVIPNDETLRAVASRHLPCVFVITERKHEKYPFLVRGYDSRRNQIFDKFFACSSFDVAKTQIQMIFSRFFQ